MCSQRGAATADRGPGGRWMRRCVCVCYMRVLRGAGRREEAVCGGGVAVLGGLMLAGGPGLVAEQGAPGVRPGSL